MDTATRDRVRQRACECCEYCRLPQFATPLLPFHIEHIVARQHGGGNDPSNLALACDRCNAYKGPNLTSIDEGTGEVSILFHPVVSGNSNPPRFMRHPGSSSAAVLQAARGIAPRPHRLIQSPAR